MKKIILTVSVNYSDYLECMINNNLNYLSEDYIWLIVTTPDDIDTLKVCESFDSKVKVMTSNVCYNNNDGKEFDKGSMINYALDYINTNYSDSVIIQMESDILIDSNFIPEMDELCKNIDYDELYSAKRLFVSKHQDYLEHIPHINDYNDLYKIFNVGQLTGIEYLQIWKNNKDIYYPSNTNASEIDTKFLNKFKHKKDMKSIVVHIGDTGVNWGGRKSKTWGEDNNENS